MTDNSNWNGPKMLSVTSAREWRKLRKEGQLVQLPSGLVARLRPVSIIDLWKSGNIPDGLTPMIGDLLVNGSVSAEKSEMTADLVSTVGQLYEIVCKAAFISPAIVSSPRDDADEIELEDVSQRDREFTLAWVSMPTTELRRFPEEQSAGMEPVEPSPSLRSASKPTASNL